MDAVQTVAVVGLGTIGRSWAAVFARAGVEVRLWDPQPDQAEKALAWLDDTGVEMRRLVVPGTLEDAADGVDFVQENGPEILEVKHRIFAELDGAAPADAILASSTSAIGMTEIAEGLTRPQRCVVAHPVNPPHVVPAVEVVGGQATSPEVVERTCAFLAEIGQEPIRLRRHVPGFLLNRLQVAVIREALHLLQEGVADVEAIDAVMHSGLGLRWAFYGPLGTAHLNADGGIDAYLDRFWPQIQDLMQTLGPTPELTPELRRRVVEGTAALFDDDDVETLQRQRDESVSALVRSKSAQR